jgi:hypothetical protein
MPSRLFEKRLRQAKRLEAATPPLFTVPAERVEQGGLL